jgi:hypothetical protein
MSGLIVREMEGSREFPRRPPRSPDFDSGIVVEPPLAFGGRHEHVDPKIGLGLYGPYTPVGQDRPPLTSIIVGIVGPATMISDAEAWLQACQSVLTNDGAEPFLHPHFPGFNTGHPFWCDLIYGDTWREALNGSALQAALDAPNFYDRIKKVVTLYIRAIEVLAQRDPRPHVILCCIPQGVIDYCTVRIGSTGENRRLRFSRMERWAQRLTRVGQLLLFREMDPTLGTEDEEWGHHNLRRGLKAEAMQFGIPTQLVWPRTLSLTNSPPEPGERRLQDIATRAWNFTTAIYHKAGGAPWRLAEVEPGVCFVGISFYRELSETNPSLRTSMAQAFTAAGDGYVLRGNSFEWDESQLGRTPHLDRKGASALMNGVLDLYMRQNRGSLPSRVVVHKTSKYWEDELAGLDDACKLVPRRDFVALGRRGIQFYRWGEYPALRGTYVKFGERDFLLYTAGYIPFLRTYPGARTPRPLEIIEHHGDSPWLVMLEELLALTKLNWNTADFACRDPITIAFAQRVGQILSELPSALPLRHEYRFYM